MITYGAALIDSLNTTSQEYIMVFLDGLKEVFSFSESLSLGQHTLIGKFNKVTSTIVIIFLCLFYVEGPWFENYLNTIKPFDDNEILQMALQVLEKLKNVANDESMPFPHGNIPSIY